MDEVIEREKIVERGIEVAKKLAEKDGKIVGLIKADQNKVIIDRLCDPILGGFSSIFPNL